MFAKGVLIEDDSGILQANGRKLAKGILFSGLSDFLEKEELFLEILHKAIIVNHLPETPSFRDMVFRPGGKA